MKIFIYHLSHEQEFKQALELFFKNTPIQIVEGSILDTECDAIVSPANSFGVMRGGLDGILTRHFGEILQERVQKEIIKDFGGELPVGMSLIVETDNEKVPYLISAPTMRESMDIHGTVNPFLAMRAILNIAHASPNIESVAIPGLGTGVGGISFPDCAHQMRVAYDSFERSKVGKDPSMFECPNMHILKYVDFHVVIKGE